MSFINDSKFINFLDKIAPFDEAQGFDNVGLLTGSLNSRVETVLIALDLSRKVLQQALELKVDLILTHHPIIFKPVKSIKTSDFLCDVVCSKINVIAVHTNLDSAKNGVTCCLAKTLNLQKIEILKGSDNFGRVGFLEKRLPYEEFLRVVSIKLGSVLKATKFDGFVHKVAVVAGSGGFALNSAICGGVDVFLTGECRHSDFIEACNHNFALVVAGHFETEIIFKESLKKQLEMEFKSVRFVVADEHVPAGSFSGNFKWL